MDSHYSGYSWDGFHVEVLLALDSHGTFQKEEQFQNLRHCLPLEASRALILPRSVGVCSLGEFCRFQKSTGIKEQVLCGVLG